jgi:hypothetical protein
VTLDELRTSLAEWGLNLSGMLPVQEYDLLVPGPWRATNLHRGCRGVLIVGNAGRTLWPIFKASPEAGLRRAPLDRYTSRVLHRAATCVTPEASVATYTDRREGGFLPLLRLAERAGFGTPGRLGILLHPNYGPWVSIRGALFLSQPVPFSVPARFDPCDGCPAPCAPACPGKAVGPKTVDPRACFRSKLLHPACRHACDARSACVLGPEHAFRPDQITHHSRIRWRPSIVRHAVRVLAG